MSDNNFTPGEALIWQNRLSGQLTRRTVAFRGMQNNLCVVAFGLKSDGTGQENLHSVSKDELSRPVPVQQPEPIPTRQPETPIPLSQRRHALSLRYTSYQEALGIVDESRQLVDRAQERVNHAQAQLRQYADLEAHAIDAVVHELKFMNTGTLTHSVADDDEEWNKREKVKRDCQIAEAALDRFTAELSHARSVADERHQLLQRAASFIVGGIIERGAEKLKRLEEQAIQLRVVLRAAGNLWLDGQPVPIGETANTMLNSWPFDHEDPIGQRVQLMEQRSAPFARLFSELCDGNIDADIQWEVVSPTH